MPTDNKKPQQPTGDQPPDLDADDDAILDAIWNEMGQAAEQPKKPSALDAMNAAIAQQKPQNKET